MFKSIASSKKAEYTKNKQFSSTENGVFYIGLQGGEVLPPLKICSKLAVIAQARDSANAAWGYLLQFSDPDGKQKECVIPAKMLASDGNQYRAILLSLGLIIEPGAKPKEYLNKYILSSSVSARVRCVDRLGWHNVEKNGVHYDVYMLSDRTIGAGQSDEQLILPSGTGEANSSFDQRGTLGEWKTHVAAHCSGNSRMQFFISTAFASTLLHHAGVPSGGFHLWGDSSTGKSAAVIVAGSVFGGADYKKSWRATDNALEPTAQKYSDALLILDELAQADPKTVGNVVYMLGNELGKGRATKDVTAKKIATWRLLFLSDGEIPLSVHMAEAGKRTKGGHDVRMAHINADAGKGLGVYETVHSFEGGAALSDHLIKTAHRYYGTAGLAFIEWAVSKSSSLRDLIAKELKDRVHKICPKNSHGQVSRVATRFALVGLAGELATAAGITGWKEGEATEAATICFNDWLASRGGVGNIEHDRMLALLPNFIRANDNRFAWKHKYLSDGASTISKLAGIKKCDQSGISDQLEEMDIAVTYLLDPKVFRDEVCKGYDSKAVLQLLKTKGVLKMSSDGKCTVPERYAGTFFRYYKISSEGLESLVNMTMQ